MHSKDNNSSSTATAVVVPDEEGAECASDAPGAASNPLDSKDCKYHDLDGLFASLYPDLPEEDGLKASRNERLSKGYRSITLTYGEVSVRGVSI